MAEFKKFGIDISKWQGNFDLASAVHSENVEFVIIKCGGGDGGLYTDKQYINNYTKCKINKIPCGAYWFSKALTEDDAVREARYCVKILENKKFELPIYMDVEEAHMLGLGKDKLTRIIETFCHYLERSKYYAGVYTSSYYLKASMIPERVARFALWIAAWGKKKPDNCGMWQFGGETNLLRYHKINGQTVDQNYLYVDYEKSIKRAKLNGFGVERKTNEEIAFEVLDGKWSAGTNRKNMLQVAGYDYNEVQKIVNALIAQRKE